MWSHLEDFLIETKEKPGLLKTRPPEFIVKLSSSIQRGKTPKPVITLTIFLQKNGIPYWRYLA